MYTAEQRERISRIYLFSAPFLLLVGLGIWAGICYAGVDLSWGAVGLGALGWLVALALRGPVALATRQLSEANRERAIVLSSGPLEEGMRVVALAVAGREFATALSLGFGWAMIEVLFTMQQALVIGLMIKRDDEKTRQGLAIMKERGMLSESPNAWGAVERLFASLLHMGNTLLVAFNPWLALLTAPVHSALNWYVSRMASKSIARAEGLIALASTLTFIIGLLVFGRI